MQSSQKLYLFKRENGYYYIGYFIDDKLHWKSTGSKLKSEAQKKLSNIQELLSEKIQTISHAHFIKEFLAYAKNNYSKNTLVLFTIALKHLFSITGNIPLKKITPRHLDLYKMKRQDDGISPTSINIELRELRSAFYTAKRWKYIETNPVSNIQFVSVPETPPVFFSKIDFEILNSHIKEQWLKDVVFFAVMTGMRRGEILNLSWENIDLEKRLIQIQSSGNYKTKMGKRRTIPINDAALYLLQRKAANSAGGFVFTKNGRKIQEHWISHKLKEYVIKLGLNPKLHFHSLRHSHASFLAMSNVSIYQISKLLGHADVKTTQKYYAHLQPEELHGAVNKIQFTLN